VAEFEETAQDLYEHAPCGYLSTAPDGTIVRVNATLLRWLGYRAEELVGRKRFQDLLSVGARIYHETHYAPMLRMQGAVREIAVDLVAADGRRLPALVNSVLLTDAEGNPRVVRTTVFDATERHLYERELLAARDRERSARDQLERLQGITSALAAAPDVESIARSAIDQVISGFGAEAAGVLVGDPYTGELQPLAGHGEAIEVIGPQFDEGEAGERPATARLRLGTRQGLEGILWLKWPGARPFAPGEPAVLMAVAEQTTVALERARLYEQTRDVAQTLQRSFLEAAVPEDPRFTVASLYRPAIEHLQVGGDWHDAFRLPSGRVGVVIGDVVGRGLAAATAMGHLRSAVRALALAGNGPAALLEHLDSFVVETERARFATVAYAEVDPATGAVAFASAGPLPPIVIDPAGEPELYTATRGTPVGLPIPGSARDQASFRLSPGSAFLLYTDGLVERRRESIDVGFERLLDAVRSGPELTPEGLADALLEAPTHDDVCILYFRLDHTGPAAPAGGRRRAGSRI
jgi:PAS domain S-box-containing protein